MPVYNHEIIAFCERDVEAVTKRAIERNGSLLEDYNYHIAGIVKGLFFKKWRWELDTCMLWCVELRSIDESITIKPRKVIKYLFK